MIHTKRLKRLEPQIHVGSCTDTVTVAQSQSHSHTGQISNGIHRDKFSYSPRCVLSVVLSKPYRLCLSQSAKDNLQKGKGGSS